MDNPIKNHLLLFKNKVQQLWKKSSSAFKNVVLKELFPMSDCDVCRCEVLVGLVDSGTDFSLSPGSTGRCRVSNNLSVKSR
eukprot:scaffold6355_cov119-Cylindrotheca_fusiformis.AAC.13